jgi:terminase, large subunit
MGDADWLAGVESALRPPPKLTLSQWADTHFRLSAESSAVPGRWRTLPYQREILDAITDPRVQRVSVKKSARIGYTKCINAAIAYFIHHDPCSIMVVQPTVDGAKIYSREEIAPMLRDVEVLAPLLPAAGAKKTGRTILHKEFPGGVLSMVGANSGAGFRSVSRRVVIFDEVDGYPPSAGDEGDPIKLGEKRAEFFWNRKIIAGSTPLIAGASRIDDLFESGDRRRYHVPCPHCAHEDVLVFEEKAARGHYMQWPDEDPQSAHFVCRSCGCIIEEEHKLDMISRGRWVAEGEFRGHASFHIWAAYSTSPNASWGEIAREYLEVRKDPDKHRTFVNTTLGETWVERGEAPDWERLHERRESYEIGTVPDGPIILTAGVDVQQNRFVYEVVGWAGASKESWSVDAGIIWGDTAKTETWDKLDEFLDRTFQGDDGTDHKISMMAIDAGYATQIVYRWARKKPMSRVIACKGMAGARSLVGAPSSVDVTLGGGGKKLKRGYRVWPVGVDLAKGELYGLKRGEDGTYPPGYCHFPEYAEGFFKEITAEHLVTVVNKRTNKATMEWQQLPNRENHYLDARVLARVAAAVLGIDRMKEPKSGAGAASKAPASADDEPAPSPSNVLTREEAPSSPARPRRPGGFWDRSGSSRGGGWFSRRR